MHAPVQIIIIVRILISIITYPAKFSILPEYWEIVKHSYPIDLGASLPCRTSVNIGTDEMTVDHKIINIIIGP